MSYLKFKEEIHKTVITITFLGFHIGKMYTLSSVIKSTTFEHLENFIFKEPEEHHCLLDMINKVILRSCNERTHTFSWYFMETLKKN